MEGRYSDAILNYRRGLQQNADSAELHFRLALADAKVENWRESYQQFVRAVELAPERKEYRVELADLALRSYEANPQKPKVLYDQIDGIARFLLEKDPNSFDGLRFRGDVMAIDGKFDEALAEFQKAQMIRPFDPKLILPMSQVLFRLEQDTEGERLAQKCIESHKTFGAIYEALYKHYLATGRLTEAEGLLKTWVANQTKESYPRLQLATFYMRNHQDAAMRQTLQEIVNKPYDFPDGHKTVGDYFALNARPEDALEEYRAGLKSTGIKDDARIIYRKRIAKLLIQTGRGDQALEEIGKILAVRPDEREAQIARALILRDSKDPKKIDTAIGQLSALAGKDPSDDHIVRYNLGIAYLLREDDQNARAQFLDSARVSRAYLAPRLALAELSQKTQAYAETVRFANEVLAVDPENSDARLWLAAGLIGNKAYTQARLELNALLRRYPDSMNVNLHIAALDTEEKRYREAEERYSKLYKSGQTDLRPLAGMIQIYVSERRMDKALKLLEEEAAKTPQSRPVHLLLADTAAAAGKFDLAVHHYEWLKASEPDSAKPYASLGEVYRVKGDIATSLANYRKARELSPNDSRISDMVAYLESAAGRNSDAIADFERELKRNPDDTTAMNNLAFAYAETGTDLDRAQTLAEKAQRKSPNSPAIADTLGWVYAKKGLNESASQIFSGLVRKFPDEPAFRYHLGVALLQQGRRAEAKAQFDLSLSKRPSKEMAEKIKEIVARMS